VVAAGVATAASLLLWASAPVTGASDLRGVDAATASTLRYLLPTVSAALLALALAARTGRRAEQAVLAILTVVLGLNVWQLFELGYPAVPSPRGPLVGAVAGGVAAYALGRLPAGRWGIRPSLGVVVAVLAGAALAAAAPGMIDRHRRMPVFDGPLLGLFEGPAGDGRPIWMAPMVTGMLSGPRLEREITAIGRGTPCEEVAARARRGWLIVGDYQAEELFGPTSLSDCVRRWRPMFTSPGYRVYGPDSLPRARPRR
jgi:hypothetical protein